MSREIIRPTPSRPETRSTKVRRKGRAQLLRDALYVTTTPPALLREAIKNSSEASDGRTLSRSVELAERRLLQSQFGLHIAEPGEFVEEISEWVSSSIPPRLQKTSEADSQFVEQTVADIESLGRVPRKRVRSTRKMFKKIPLEHAKESVNAITLNPIRGITQLLQERSNGIDPQINPEIYDVLKTLARRFKDKWEGTAGTFEKKTKTIGYKDSKVDLSIAWTSIHEGGHSVFNQMLTDEQRATWKELSKKPITKYAEKVSEDHRHLENFAEMYALYTLGRPILTFWSMVNKDISKQYKFFKSFMPKGTPLTPSPTGIMRITTDKFFTGLAFKAIEKALPTTVGDMTDIYRSDFEDQTLSPGAHRQNAERIGKFFLGGLKPGEIDQLVVSHLGEEFITKNLDIIHDNYRMKEFLIRNGILQETDKDKIDFGLCGLEEEENQDLYYAIPIFLKNRILFITPNGKKRVPYTAEVKTQINEAIKSDTIYKTKSPLAEVQQDGIRALVEPSEAEIETKEAFAEKYGIPLQDSSNRAFSAQVIENLDGILEQIPPEDRETIKGFIRVRDSNEKNKDQRKLIRRGFIPVHDYMLTGTYSDLERNIIGSVAQEAIGNNPLLFENFLEISHWERKRLGMLPKIIFAYGNHSKIPADKYRITDQNQSTFLLPFEPGSIIQDFATCYVSYLTTTEQFREKAQDDPVLQAKYDLLTEHFSSAQRPATIN